MLHGLLWLPLLGVFFTLTGLGWYEWQKIQAYERWAANFDKSKYDVQALLGLKGTHLTWGKPTRTTPQNLQTVDLKNIQAIEVWVNQQPLVPPHPPQRIRHIELVLLPTHQRIPFTELELANRWAQYLRTLLAPPDHEHSPGLGTLIAAHPSQD